MEDLLARHEIPFRFIDAIDGRSMQVSTYPAYDRLRRLLFFGRDLKGGEIGCLLSHALAYQKIIDENHKAALIFEDDVQLCENFKALVTEAMSHIQHFEIVRFLGKEKLLQQPHKSLYPIGKTHSLAKVYGLSGGLYAYLITREGAKKMLRLMQHNYLPVDTLCGSTWMTGARSLIVMPPDTASVQDHLGSLIGEARFNKSRKDAAGLVRLAYPLTRMLYKIYEAAMKRLAYIF